MSSQLLLAIVTHWRGSGEAVVNVASNREFKTILPLT